MSGSMPSRNKALMIPMCDQPREVHDQFLNQARKERILVTIIMMSGDSLEGYIKSFDSFCVLVDGDSDILLYKHAIGSITSKDGAFRLHGGRD